MCLIYRLRTTGNPEQSPEIRRNQQPTRLCSQKSFLQPSLRSGYLKQGKSTDSDEEVKLAEQ